jgi:prephenate dehydratase
MKTIVYQGVKGSFSYLTAVKRWGEDNHFLGMNTFREVFEAVAEGRADAAVIPIENSLAGSIYENYDWLIRYDLSIVGEAHTKIEHCLLGLGKVEDLKKVFSHPKALEQCTVFLRAHPEIKSVVHADTAGAAADVAASGDPSLGSIASRESAEIYGLKVLRAQIEDEPNNYTRFLFVTKRAEPVAHANKCSLSFTLEHTPGKLASVLQHLSQHGMNLMKIESRPIKTKPFEYVFYVDVEFTDPASLTLLKDYQILGFYEKDQNHRLGADGRLDR